MKTYNSAITRYGSTIFTLIVRYNRILILITLLFGGSFTNWCILTFYPQATQLQTNSSDTVPPVLIQISDSLLRILYSVTLVSLELTSFLAGYFLGEHGWKKKQATKTTTTDEVSVLEPEEVEEDE